MSETSVRRDNTPWRARTAASLVIVVAIATVWWTNQFLTERFTETTRSRAEVRLAHYSGNILSELQRNQVVPQLLARDPALIRALMSGDFLQSSQRLIEYRDGIAAAGLMLLDRDGRAVAATDRALIGSAHRTAPYFVEASRSNDTVFSTSLLESGARVFTHSRKIEAQGEMLGVIMVEVDLKKFESSWAGFTDAVIVSDSEATIILATEPRWRGLSEEEALAARRVRSAMERAVRATASWGALPVDAYLKGETIMRQEARIGFQGWRITSFTTYASIRERVNAVLALEIMGFAILVALVSYLVSRRATSRLRFFQRESAELRQLNMALQREISERKRAERHLKVAEQTLQQSSKLAALGEMSAAVSHELNQPLAAMKTYLAGARLLLGRRRADEALSSFERIDDLIEHMSQITRQLKSHAHKGGGAAKPVDVRESVSSVLSMMESQLRQDDVNVITSLPQDPVIVRVDNVRLEQVLVNLVRNALDATSATPEPRIEILVAVGEEALVTVRDNGAGIEDLEKLFEPFYTTKMPGDGVGLGLAISSGIVNELGGRLTARNGRDGGAVFEVTLPISTEVTAAAE
ncbi:MAG: sensor histidine kinase [Boseongicola sp. SB0675_bin_26]|nr:sensor histidine kinase [Boseongicola sp. SB0675_bin_26]